MTKDKVYNLKKVDTTEQQILDVAERLFLDRGFALTSTTMIAKEVGCNQALIHYYFRTKENLFLTLFENKFVGFITSLSTLEFEGLSIKDKLRRVIFAHIDMIAKSPKLPFLLLTEFYNNPGRLEGVIERIKMHSVPFLMRISQDISLAVKAGQIREIDPFGLLLNVLSLNIFLFVSKPVVMNISGMDQDGFDSFVEIRKEEIYETIWRSISIN